MLTLWLKCIEFGLSVCFILIFIILNGRSSRYWKESEILQNGPTWFVNKSFVLILNKLSRVNTEKCYFIVLCCSFLKLSYYNVIVHISQKLFPESDSYKS